MTINMETGTQLTANFALLRNLPGANNKPLCANRDTDLNYAISQMMLNDFSQLPVMQADRKVEGYISWRTIGEAYGLKKECKLVRDCMEKEAIILDADEPLLKAVDVIAKREFVLVRDPKDQRIIGLVTASTSWHK